MTFYLVFYSFKIVKFCYHMKTYKWKTARLDYIVKQSKTIIHMHRGVYEFYYALINFMPHSLPWAQRRFDKLRLNGSCIGAKYLIKCTLCFHTLIGLPTHLYGCDHCHFVRRHLIHVAVLTFSVFGRLL